MNNSFVDHRVRVRCAVCLLVLAAGTLAQDRPAAVPVVIELGEPFDFDAIVRFSADGRVLAYTGDLESSRDRRRLCVFDTANGRRLASIDLDSSPEYVVVSPDGSIVAVAPRTGTQLLLLRLGEGKPRVERFDCEGRPGPIEFAATRSQLVIGVSTLEESCLEIRDFSGRRTARTKAGTKPVSSVVFGSDDASILFTFSGYLDMAQIFEWDLAKLSIRATGVKAYSLAANSARSQLIGMANLGRLILLDLRTLRILGTATARFSNDHELHWCGERIGNWTLLDSRTGRRMPHIPGLIGTARSGHVAVGTHKSRTLSVWKSADDVPPEVRAPAIPPERRQAELKTRTDKFREVLAGSIRFDEERQAFAFAAFDLSRLVAEAVPVLTQTLEDRRPRVRTVVARTLADLGADARDAVPSLTRRLESQEEGEAWTAAQAIARIGCRPEHVPALLRVRRSEDASIRADILTGLTAAGPRPEIIAALTAATEDSDGHVRRTAAWCLADLGPPAAAALPALKKLESDADHFTRGSAKRAIERLR